MIEPLCEFETQRLKARRLVISDLALLHEMNTNPEIMATLGGVCEIEETKKRLAWNLEQWQANAFGLWLFFEKGSGLFVGRGGIRRLPIDGKEEVEVAYALMPAFWRAGFATEIARKCVEIGFTHYQVPSLMAGTLLSNKASQRVMVKCGFRYEKEIVHFDKANVVYRISIDDFSRPSCIK